MKALFIVLDTLRRDYLEAYGNDWVKTPNLQRLAKRGITFDNHWVGSLPCMPARREFMTGRYNFIYRGWGPIEPFDDVLPRELRKRKVFSHLLTDHYHYFELGGENYHTAFDTWDFYRGQEFDPWMSLVDSQVLPEGWNGARRETTWAQQNFKNRAAQQREEDFSGPKTAQAAVEWLERNKDAQGDWFLQVEIFDPHEPFLCTEEYRAMYGDDWDGPLYDWPDYLEVKDSPEAIAHIRKCYAALLTMTDSAVGKILDKLDELNGWDDTLVVFTTDHGTLLAEHDYWMKVAMPMYHEIARIPLIVCLPGGEGASTRVAALTQTIDLMPTFLDFFGCEMPPHVHGHSLLRVLTGETVRDDCILGYFGKATNITDGRYFYMRNPVNEDCGPLHAYTSMPVGNFTAPPILRENYGQIEMGRYFSHTYNLPLYKIPATAEPPLAHAGEASYVARHELFDLQNDPQQLHPLDNAELETHFCERIRVHLQSCEAPPEQFLRLGLEPR